MPRAQFSVCNKLQRLCDQNYSLVSTFSCFRRHKPNIIYFPVYVQGTTVSPPGEAPQGAALFTACDVAAVGWMWQSESEFLQSLCCTGLLRELQPCPKVHTLISDFHMARPVFLQAASDTYMGCYTISFRTNNKLSFFVVLHRWIKTKSSWNLCKWILPFVPCRS